MVEQLPAVHADLNARQPGGHVLYQWMQQPFGISLQTANAQAYTWQATKEQSIFRRHRCLLRH